MPADFLIRRASASDAAAIASLLTQLGYPAEAAEVPGRVARMAGKDAQAFYADTGLELTGRRFGKNLD